MRRRKGGEGEKKAVEGEERRWCGGGGAEVVRISGKWWWCVCGASSGNSGSRAVVKESCRFDEGGQGPMNRMGEGGQSWKRPVSSGKARKDGV